jgi:hypothetical protein
VPGIGIYSLNKTINNFSTIDAIFAQISSISKTWRNHFKNFGEMTKNFVLGVTFWKTSQRGFQAKTAC